MPRASHPARVPPAAPSYAWATSAGSGDQPRWVRALAVESFGATIGVRVTDAALLREVAAQLPTGSRPSDGERVDQLYSWIAPGPAGGSAEHRLLVQSCDEPGEREIARGARASDVLAALRDATEFGVALHAPSLLFLHAAVVAWRGAAIVLPGRSFAGKTTLTLALLARGAEYYSDEYAVLDASGRVHPFPRPLRVRSRQGGPPSWAAPAALGARVGSTAVPVGLVVATSYVAGCGWDPERLSLGRAALALLDNTPVARARPAHAVARIAAALRPGVVALRGHRGDADAVAARLLAAADRLAGGGCGA